MSEISNEELKVFMGMKVMGWHKEFIYEKDKVADNNYFHWIDFDDKLTLHSFKTFDPPADLNQAFECVKKAVTETYWFKLDYMPAEKMYESMVADWGKTEKQEYWIKRDKHPARAVCLAIKAFCGRTS